MIELDVTLTKDNQVVVYHDLELLKEQVIDIYLVSRNDFIDCQNRKRKSFH